MTPVSPHPHPLPTRGEGSRPGPAPGTTVEAGLLPPPAWGRAGEGGHPASQCSKGRT